MREPTYSIPPEQFNLSSVSVTALALRDPLVSYNVPEESVSTTNAVVALALRELARSYVWKPEDVTIAAVKTLSVSLRTALISYATWEAEDVSITPVKITALSLT